ncbi:TetR/AcrR family transcriptional regulator [Pendulispora albinea]|uniref:TetR/AcrR family transcriptional regulator n=1 Tax=Pendulispora albinea TaxID=2741071 RepID=A0ABZ2M7J2_9BACT
MARQTTIPPHRSKGTPRTFERRAALARALDVFWRRGYEPATIAELCAAMQINPPSLYAAFGNKAQLFMEAVQHYQHVYWDAAWERMESTASVHEAMAGFFDDAVQVLTSRAAPRGCLVILAATNVSASAEAQQVNDALRALRREGRARFFGRLKRGIENGQLPSGTDLEALASSLNAMLAGMSLLARDGASRAELDRIATTAMALLPAKRRTRSRTE